VWIVRFNGIVSFLKNVSLPLIVRDFNNGVFISRIILAPGIISTSSPATGTTPLGQDLGSLQSFVVLVIFRTTTVFTQSQLHLIPYILMIDLFLMSLPFKTN